MIILEWFLLNIIDNNRIFKFFKFIVLKQNFRDMVKKSWKIQNSKIIITYTNCSLFILINLFIILHISIVIYYYYKNKLKYYENRAKLEG